MHKSNPLFVQTVTPCCYIAIMTSVQVNPGRMLMRLEGLPSHFE